MSRTNLVFVFLLALAACNGDDEALTIDGVDATPTSGSPSVVEVTFSTSASAEAVVRFGLDGELDRSTPATDPGTEHRALLVGLPGDREVSYQVVVGDVSSEVRTVTTGSLPDTLPAITVTGESDRFLLTSLATTVNVVLMFDPAGNIVWNHPDLRGLSVFRALVRRDGRGIVYSSAIKNGGPTPDSVIVDVPWDGSGETVTSVPNLAHDFVELPDGTLGALTYLERDGVEGNALVEVAADGTTTELWNSWDCYDPVENPGDDEQTGWTHANALDYDPVEDVYYVGMRNLGTVARVDRGGVCQWSLGGSGGDLEVDGARFLHQHQFEILDGGAGALVFDNDGAPGNVSRAIEYAIDAASGTATEVRTIESGDEPPLYSFIMGDVHRWDGGDTMIAWSVPGTIDRIGADDTRKWRLEIEGGGPIGFVQALVDPYVVP